VARRSETSITPPPGFVLGKDIDLSLWHDSEIAIDMNGRVYCYVGYKSEKEHNHLPYYSPSVALRERDGRTSFRFVELFQGSLSVSGFFRDDQFYQVLSDRRVVFPRGSISYFGVLSRDRGTEDATLTRAVFGGTHEEIEGVATAFAKVSGRSYHEMARLPRLTFSKTQDNRCDVSGCLIPKNFPYIAFEDAQYSWSHVSLHGFYRLLAFLCPPSRPSPIAQAMVSSGITEDVLKRFSENTDHIAYPLPSTEY
jgi:hypothetical protein